MCTYCKYHCIIFEINKTALLVFRRWKILYYFIYLCILICKKYFSLFKKRILNSQRNMIKLQKFDILYDSTVRTSPEFFLKSVLFTDTNDFRTPVIQSGRWILPSYLGNIFKDILIITIVRYHYILQC